VHRGLKMTFILADRTSPGKLAYEAYGTQVEWKSYHGEPLPTWQMLPADIKNAWESAADAVIMGVDV
jgi:hypothetical protein